MTWNKKYWVLGSTSPGHEKFNDTSFVEIGSKITTLEKSVLPLSAIGVGAIPQPPGFVPKNEVFYSYLENHA